MSGSEQLPTFPSSSVPSSSIGYKPVGLSSEVPAWVGALFGVLLASFLFMSAAAFIMVMDAKADIRLIEIKMENDRAWIVTTREKQIRQEERDAKRTTR